MDSVVADLQVELQDLQTHKIQTERENTALRTDVQQLNQELHTFHQQYREKGRLYWNKIHIISNSSIAVPTVVCKLPLYTTLMLRSPHVDYSVMTSN